MLKLGENIVNYYKTFWDHLCRIFNSLKRKKNISNWGGEKHFSFIYTFMAHIFRSAHYTFSHHKMESRILSYSRRTAKFKINSPLSITLFILEDFMHLVGMWCHFYLKNFVQRGVSNFKNITLFEKLFI